MSARWATAWGRCRPVSYELRSCLRDRWVRFHSLPGSQRYAATDNEHAEIMRRHTTMLTELLKHDTADADPGLMLVTASWSAAHEPATRGKELATAIPAANYWTSVLTDDTEPEPVWTHLWISQASLHSQDLPRLLRLVAGYGTGGVIITTTAMNWLYAPYDGGADVIAASPGHRDQLRDRYSAWLPPHPSGL